MIDRIAGGQIPTSTNTSNSVQSETNKVQASEPVQLNKETKEQSSYPKEKLEKIVEGLNNFVLASNTHLKFELHEKLHEYYVKIVDNQTDEVIKEIPSKKMLDVFAAMTDFLGLIMDKKI